MIPTEQALADMAAIRCDQDGGDSPFGWWDGSTLTPATPPRGAVRALSVPEPVRGPSGQWTTEIAGDGRTGPRGVAPGQPEIGYGGDGRFTGYLTDTAGSASTPEAPSRGLAGVLPACEPTGGESEPDGGTAQTGAQSIRSSEYPTGDPR